MEKQEKKEVNKQVNSIMKKIISFLVWLIATVIVWGFIAPMLVSWDDDLLVIAGYALVTLHILVTIKIVLTYMVTKLTKK